MESYLCSGLNKIKMMEWKTKLGLEAWGEYCGEKTGARQSKLPSYLRKCSLARLFRTMWQQLGLKLSYDPKSNVSFIKKRHKQTLATLKVLKGTKQVASDPSLPGVMKPVWEHEEHSWSLPLKTHTIFRDSISSADKQTSAGCSVYGLNLQDLYHTWEQQGPCKWF